MTDDTKTTITELFKTVLQNPQAWLFVLLLIAMAGGGYVTNKFFDSAERRETKMHGIFNEGIEESNQLRNDFYKQALEFDKQHIESRKRQGDHNERISSAMERIGDQLQRIIDNKLVSRVDPCDETLTVSDEELGSELYR